MQLGKTIQNLRKAKNITQEELAQALGVTPQAVSKWENDLSCPDISLLPSLAAFFRITVDSLLSGNTEESDAPNERCKDETEAGETKKENKETKTAGEETASAENAADGQRIAKTIKVTVQKNGKTTNISMPVTILDFGLKIGSGFGALNAEQERTISEAVKKGLLGEILCVKGENGEDIVLSLE